jgi:hypothetical protein
MALERKNGMNRPIGLALIALGFILMPDPVAAQTVDEYHPFLSDTFNLEIGYYRPNIDYDIGVAGSVPEIEFDFDEAFKIDDDQQAGAINFRWRFGKKWSLWGQYWETDTEGSAVLEKDILWEDFVLKTGTFAEGDVNLKIVRVYFGREFSAGPKHEFGLGLGLHWMEMEASISGEVFINEESSEFRRLAVGASLPLPNIGAWYMYSWSPRWAFQSRVDWLNASIKEYSGGLWHAQAGINWQVFKKFGLGFYYRAFQLEGDVNKGSWHGSLRMQHDGPELTLTASW